MSAALKNSLTLLTQPQREAIDFITNNDHGLVIAFTGAGKTVIALSAIAASARKTIVTAPPKVLDVWIKEAAKWEHTQHLRITLLKGNHQKRAELLQQPADVLLISLNSLDWLLDQEHQATAIYIDELSKASGKRAAKLKNKACDVITKRIGLTATPVSENFQKLHPMLRIIDHGKALGRSKEAFLARHFYPTDYNRTNWELHPGQDKVIMERIKHLVHNVSANKAESLPPISYEELEFDMPSSTRAVYDQMRKDMLLESDRSDIIAVNMAVLSSKLRQISSGFAIAEDRSVTEYDTARAETLADLLDELNSPALVIYEYDYQRQQIEKTIRCSYASVCGGYNNQQGIAAFTEGHVQALIAQQNTLSHGVDGLQHVAHHIIFYHPLWSNDATEQAAGRIWRQGQTNPTTVTTLVCADTLDDVVLARLGDKSQHMKAFLKHLRE